MLGALITLLFCVSAVGLGRLLIGRWTVELDPTAKIGLAGLVGLGAVGTLTLFVGLLPEGLHWGIGIIGLLALLGLAVVAKALQKKSVKFEIPKDLRLAAVVLLVFAGLFSLAGVLAPSDTVDWDSLAYHLAVPKIWLAAGRIEFISYIHHSNFPFTVDNLYIWGMTWGGQSGAKAFSLCFSLFGLLSIFGLARRQYGEKAAWWSAVAFGTTPVVVWLSGTAYIDVANGLYGGLGVVFAAMWIANHERNDAILSGILIGLCAASKYTGLQIIIVALATVVLSGFAQKAIKVHFRAAVMIGAIALAIASPWYIKNVIQTGNPVYPFFYSMFGGKNWDTFSDQIYKDQQQTFGAGRDLPEEGKAYTAGPLKPARLGHAILGLAYQPGRYIDPQPVGGQGFIFGSLGFAAIGAGLLWMFSGRARKFELAILGTLGLALMMWFVLSEQSRYILGLTVPLCVLLGGAVSKLKTGTVMAVGCALQAIVSLYAVKDQRLDTQLQVLTGKVTPEEYQKELTGFYEPAQWINENVKGKVALYDEVFGYFLDIPYFWAAPGNTTEIGYDKLESGDALVAKLKEMGMTHVYINLPSTYGGDHAARDRWAAAAGLGVPPQPFSPEERAQAFEDIRNKYKVLLAEAIADHKLVMIKSFGTKLLFEITP